MSSAEDLLRWLVPTRMIDSDHEKIRNLVGRLTAGASNNKEKALCIYAHVRDEVLFGWAPEFYDQRASDVLECKVGFCNTKATLFVAMLRAAGIPARMHMVTITSDIIAPFVSTGGPFVDHAYTEVYLNERWVKVDSYTVDTRLWRNAVRQLAATDRVVGFGAHRDGENDWDGESDSFVQFVDNGAYKLTSKDFGVQEDLQAFYASGQGMNRMGWFMRCIFPWIIPSANRRVDTLRNAQQ